MAENAQFLSETHSEHIKRRAKVSAFKRTLLEGHTTSQSVFIGVFVSIWPFKGFFKTFSWFEWPKIHPKSGKKSEVLRFKRAYMHE